MGGWKAKLVATEGLLVNGENHQTSPAFESEATAMDWVRATIEGNLNKAKKVKFIGFIRVKSIDITDDEILNGQESLGLSFDELFDVQELNQKVAN